MIRHIFLGLFFVHTLANFASACSCKAKPELSVMNLNDSELIFTATLEEYSLGMAVGSLKFKPKKVFKGELNETITIFFKLKESHTLFSKSVKFQEEKDWIVFAHKKVIGSRAYIRLIDSENSTFCALSRPISPSSDRDKYLDYLAEMGNQPDGYRYIIEGDSILVAEGTYKNNQPSNLWKYYHPDGKLNISGHYLSGSREGEWQKFTSNSKRDNIVIQKRFYEKGALREIHDLKYSGEVTFKKFLSDSSEVRHYLYTDGSIKTKTIKNKEDDSMQTFSYYKNGVLREEKHFIGDKLMQKIQFDEKGAKNTEWTRSD